jgi:hypothetical protein
MATNLNDMKRNNSSSAYDNAQSTDNVNAIIQEIKQDVLGMNQHFKDYMRKVDDAGNAYQKEISATMAKLTKMVN